MDDNILLRLLEQEITALFRTRAAKEKKGGWGANARIQKKLNELFLLSKLYLFQ